MLRIVIVDDHAVVRSGLRQFLATTEGFEVAAEAATGSEVLELVSSIDADVVLLDITLPDINGLEVLKRIKRIRSGLPVLIFSMFAEDEFALPALHAGASGYLNKDSPPAQILTAIRTVVGGGRYVSPALAERLIDGTIGAARRLPHETLSPREMAVLLLLSQGISLTRIGEQLNLSVKTISTYRSRILDKLDVQSNAEITRYVLQHNLGED
jgi:two-component system, NarL family, invasion response regulator UvrY